MKALSTFCLIGAALIAGCGGERAATLVPAGPQQPSVARGSAAQRLIWTIDIYVYGYTYAGQQAVELTGFSDPVGLCTDPSSDLYVVDAGRQEIFVYAPGQLLPFYIYDDFGQTPNGCAFDPTTGNLAVTNKANLTIFPPASAMPLTYTSPQIGSYSYADYDKSGNLYLDGVKTAGGFALAELPAGAKQLTYIKTVNLVKGTRHRAAGIVWDGQDLAVADYASKVLYRIAVSGSTGTIIDTWHLAHWRTSYVPVFVVAGKRLIFPHAGEVQFFSYPPEGHIKNGFLGNIGELLTVSPEVIN